LPQEVRQVLEALEVLDDRGFTRQSAKTRSWEETERKAKTMELQPPKRQADQAGRGSAEPPKRKTIESAVEKFLKNKNADGIDQGTYYHSGFGHAPAVPRVGQSKSLVSPDEITLEDLETSAQHFPAIQ
jgi:hypothetical protein